MSSPPSTRRLASLPLDVRDQRLIDGASRWMGLLGRFQVITGALMLLACVGVGVGWTFAELTAPEIESDTTPPLVRLGDVSTAQAATALVVVTFLALLVLRGGVLLTDAAEDFEHHVSAPDDEAPYLEDALTSVSRAFLIDATLLVLVAVGLAWLGSLA